MRGQASSLLRCLARFCGRDRCVAPAVLSVSRPEPQPSCDGLGPESTTHVCRRCYVLALGTVNLKGGLKGGRIEVHPKAKDLHPGELQTAGTPPWTYQRLQGRGLGTCLSNKVLALKLRATAPGPRSRAASRTVRVLSRRGGKVLAATGLVPLLSPRRLTGAIAPTAPRPRVWTARRLKGVPPPVGGKAHPFSSCRAF